MMPGRNMARRTKPTLRTVSSLTPITLAYRNRLRAVLPAAESRQNWAIPALWQPRAKAPTTPTSSRCNSSSLQRTDPEPTPTQLTALTGPWLKTPRARAAVRSAKSAAPVLRTTLRTRDRGSMGFLVTITTSRHSEVASNSATAAPPTCPVPPRIIAAKSCFTNRTSADYLLGIVAVNRWLAKYVFCSILGLLPVIQNLVSTVPAKSGLCFVTQVLVALTTPSPCETPSPHPPQPGVRNRSEERRVG